MFLVQSFGFLLYTTEYVAKDNEDGHVLFIPQVQNYWSISMLFWFFFYRNNVFCSDLDILRNSVFWNSWMTRSLYYHDLTTRICRCVIEHKCSSLALLRTRVCGQLLSALLKGGQTGDLICQIRDATQILYTFWYQYLTSLCHCFGLIWHIQARTIWAEWLSFLSLLCHCYEGVIVDDK